MRFMRPTLSALLLAAAGSAALAHDVWVQPQAQAQGQGLVVLYGHADKQDAYDHLKLKTLTALDAQGQALPVRRLPAAGKDAPLAVQVEGRPVLALMVFDDGFWTKTEDGWKNLARNAVSGTALQSAYEMTLAKTVLAWSPQATRVHGLPLEIVPLQAEAPAKGALLPVQVLWEGKPLAGAKIALPGPGKPAPAQTDAQGKAGIPVVGGLQVISVTHKLVPRNEPRTDLLAYTANLVIDVK
jgi:nickel transport protein